MGCQAYLGLLPDLRWGAVLLQHAGHLSLEVLQDGKHPAVRRGRAVQGVRGLEAAFVRSVTDTAPAGLVVRRVRARRDLAVPLLRREPRFDVVALRRR